MRLASASAVLALLGPLAWAPSLLGYPGSARWGYANCSTCHYNVSGGGVLTPYGRQLSRELLSTFGGEEEPLFAYGLSTPEWLALGGDFMALVSSDRDPASNSRLEVMQADLEAAITTGRFLAVGTLGLEPDPAGALTSGFVSRRHYVQVELARSLSIRAGRFLPNYGIWAGDLTVATRAGLGWDENSESYNVEANFIQGRFSAAATGIFGTQDQPSAERESGGSFKVVGFFFERLSVGGSALATSSDTLTRRAAAVHGVLGIGDKAYLQAEVDVQRLRPCAGEPDGRGADLLGNVCFAHETVKGLYVLLTDEFSRVDLDEPGRVRHTYGVGLRWFIRPHVEVRLRWLKRQEGALAPGHYDGPGMIVRFYL